MAFNWNKYYAIYINEGKQKRKFRSFDWYLFHCQIVEKNLVWFLIKIILITINFFFFTSYFSTYIEESIGFAQIFDFRFLRDLHVLECPEQDLTIFGKCLSVYVSVCLGVCDKNFVASVARELMNRISWNFIFNIPPT